MKYKNTKTKEILSETQFYIVKEVKGDVLHLTNDEGKEITVSKEYAEKCLKSASQFDIVEKVSRTELIAIFLNSTNRAITVCFNKQTNPEDARKSLYDLYSNKGGKLVSEDDFKTKVDDVLKSVMTGKERVMIGRHYGKLTEHGRYNFIDMEAEKDTSKSYETRMKQIDPRTLNFIIVDDKKYEVK